MNSGESDSIFYYQMLSKSVSRFDEILLETYYKPSEDYGINLEFLAYSGCCLLFTLLMTRVDQREAEYLVENILEEITDYWDSLNMDDFFDNASKIDPNLYKLIMEGTSKEFLDNVKTKISKRFSVPNQITTIQGMRFDYVIKKTLEYWSCVMERITSMPESNKDAIAWVEEAVESLFLKNIYPIYERPAYNNEKGIFGALSVYMRSEYEDEMIY